MYHPQKMIYILEKDSGDFEWDATLRFMLQSLKKFLNSPWSFFHP